MGKRSRFTERVEQIDRVGGRLYFGFWGVLVGLAVLVIALPGLVIALLNGAWLGAAAAAIAGIVMAALAGYLLSPKRRLSDIE